jgi:hypothetical protein
MHLCDIEALAVVKTALGRALSPKGSFPARPRIRGLGQQRSSLRHRENAR